MPCKPGVAGSIPGFSIKSLSVEPTGPVLVSTHGKGTKSCVCFFTLSVYYELSQTTVTL